MPTDRAREDVSADMERIFKPLAGRERMAADEDSGSPVGRKSRLRNWRPLTLAAPALVIVVSAAVAIGYARVEMPDPHGAKFVESASLVDSSVPSSIPSSSAARSGASPPAGLTATLARPTATTTAGDRQAATSTAAPLRHPDVARTPASRRTRGPEFVQGVAGSPGSAAEPPSAVPPCEPGSEEDHCIYQDVLNADARLRLAYDRASRNGVSDARLAAVGRRWMRAREDAGHDPDGTIERYEELADTLDDARSRTDQ